MSDVEFVDANILVYTHDLAAGAKRNTAKALVDRLWTTRVGALSTQVLAEFFVVVTRKVKHPLDPPTAKEAVSLYSRWNVVHPEAADIVAAIDLATDRKIRFWDAMIVVAAQRANASILWSEDLQDGTKFAEVGVRNPFVAHAMPSRGS